MSARTENERFLRSYDEHADPLFRFCYAYLGNREHAKDAVQETFFRAWNYVSRGKRIDDMKPFLYRTARNLLTDLSRRPSFASLDAMRDEGFDAPDQHTPDPMLSTEAARAVRLASRLDDTYRDALLLRYVDGMPPRDIAALTGETENAVSVRIHRGLQKLRELMEGRQS